MVEESPAHDGKTCPAVNRIRSEGSKIHNFEGLSFSGEFCAYSRGELAKGKGCGDRGDGRAGTVLLASAHPRGVGRAGALTKSSLVGEGHKMSGTRYQGGAICQRNFKKIAGNLVSGGFRGGHKINLGF